MTIYIGADHGGFELKRELSQYLEKTGYAVVDCGNKAYEPDDDYPDFSKNVANAVGGDKDSRGIVICRNGVGVCISANRFRGIYCALGFDAQQIRKARQHDFINILALPSDYKTLDECIELIKVFLETEPLPDPKYLRRLQKIEL